MDIVKNIVFSICALTGAVAISINVVAFFVSVWAKRILKTLEQAENSQGQHTQD